MRARWPPRGRCPRRSAWRPSGRTSARPRSRPRRPSRRARPGPTARGSRRSCPARARSSSTASSALIRHSIAWPRISTSSCLKDSSLARRDQDLLAHDVDAGDHLGHAVLDLHAGVHLEEVVLAVLEQALDRAGRAVADGLGGLGADLADPLAQLLVDGGGRGSPRSASGGGAGPSSRARPRWTTLPWCVGEHLDLDVARVGQVALDVDRRVGEELLALARRALEGAPRARPRSARRGSPCRRRRPRP